MEAGEKGGVGGCGGVGCLSVDDRNLGALSVQVNTWTDGSRRQRQIDR